MTLRAGHGNVEFVTRAALKLRSADITEIRGFGSTVVRPAPLQSRKDAVASGRP